MTVADKKEEDISKLSSEEIEEKWIKMITESIAELRAEVDSLKMDNEILQLQMRITNPSIAEDIAKLSMIQFQKLIDLKEKLEK